MISSVPEPFMFFSILYNYMTMTTTGIISPSCFVTCVTITSHLLSKSKINKIKVKKNKMKPSLLFIILILASAEFVINSIIYLATKVFFFITNYIRELKIEINIRKKRKIEKATKFVKKNEVNSERSRDNTKMSTRRDKEISRQEITSEKISRLLYKTIYH